MAAEEHSGVEVVSEEQLTEGTELTTNDSVEGHVTPNMADEDILSQAFVDTADFSAGVEIRYSEEGVGLPEGSMITTNDEGVTFITSDDVSDQLSQFTNGTFQVLTADQVVETDANYTPAITEDINAAQVMDTESALELQKIDDSGVILTADQAVTIPQNTEPLKTVLAIPQGAPVSLTSGAPLGSSQNPIRIIQQGNQYTPVQQLSTDQLQQIMQVVQQQQMANSVEGGSSVLFNPQTNTRIVYRVIYPSELHKDKPSITNSMQTAQSIQTTPKKVYRKRNKEEESEMRDGPTLSKEEKEMRKKARAKTRSGRVSKPPKHMVKDFKHIHVLDYDEDYDDSDGGYSDYKVEESDEDENGSRKDENDLSVVPGLTLTKPKKWKCVTCERAYIGRAGLGRHLKQYPSHGSIEVEGDGDMVPPPPGTEIIMNGSSSTDNTPNIPLQNGTPNGTTNSNASLSEDSRDSSYSLPYTPTPTPSRRGNARGRPRGSRGWRGRWAYNKVDPELRRRNKLKDLVRDCTDEELMEIVLPRLAKVITLWEFLLMKVEKGDPARPHIDDVYMEYEKLHASVRKLCQEYLQFIPDTEVTTEKKVLHVENTVVAEALGLKTGSHAVKEIVDMDTSDTYNYKLLTTNKSVVNKPLLKRTVEVVSPEQILSPSKKLRNGPMKHEISDSAANGNLSNSLQSVLVSVSTSNSASSHQVISAPSQPTSSTSVILSNFTTTPTVNIQPAANSSTEHYLKIQPAVNSSAKHVLNIQPGTNSLLNVQPPVNSSTNHVFSIQPSHNSSNKNVICIQPTNSSAITSLPNAVSLLSNSVLTSVPFQPKSSQPSQKFIVVSGLNPSQNLSSVSGTQSILQQVDCQTNPSQQVEPVNVVLPVSKKQSDGQEPAQSQNTILQTCSSDSKSEQDSVVDQSRAIDNSSGMVQQHYFTLRESLSQPRDSLENETQSVYQISLQNTTNEINPSVSQTVTNPEDLIDSGQVHVGTGDEKIPNSDLDNTLAIQNSEEEQSEEVFVVQSGAVLQNTQSDLVNAESVQNDIVNIVRTQNDEVILTPSQTEIRSDQLTPSTNTDQILGVASIDNSDMTGQIQTITEPMECDSQPEQTSDLSQQIYDTVDLPASVSIQDTSVEYINESTDQTEVYQYETNSVDTDQSDTVQIPATNIFQLEDGAIFIQNQDGSLIQLQSSDGQNVSMEAVQAFLASSGNNQVIDNSVIYNQSDQT